MRVALRPRSLWLMVALVASSLLLGACENRTPEQIAIDEVAAGLRVHQAGNLDEAMNHYLEALRHDARNKFAYYNLGVIHQSTGENVVAEQNYRLALIVDPEFAPALFNLAILRTAAGARDEAIDLYRQVLAATPENAGAHFNLGLLLRQAGQQAEGDEEVRIGIGLDPSLVDPEAAALPAPGGSPASSPAASPSSS